MAALMSLSLLFLSLYVLCEDPAPTFRAVDKAYFDSNTNVYKFRIKQRAKNCRNAYAHPLWFGLRRAYVHMVLYHKHTRRIVSNRAQWDTWTPSLEEDFHFYYDGNFTDYAIGMYILNVRSDQERKNENPISNPYVRDSKGIDKVAEYMSLTAMPGTGSDFSRMYHESPHMYSYILWHKDKRGKTGRLRENEPERCAKTAQWVSNEGFYKLDLDTLELTPIYYHPDATDFFY